MLPVVSPAPYPNIRRLSNLTGISTPIDGSTHRNAVPRTTLLFELGGLCSETAEGLDPVGAYPDSSLYDLDHATAF